MRNTEGKRSKAKNIAISAVCLILSVLVLLISFGKGIGFPDWYDVFAFFKIYPDTKDKLTVSFISVGYADAIYIHEGDTDILIDTGYDNSCKEIKSYLNRYNCENLNAVFITHPDADHIGGMSEILNTYGADTLYMYSLPAEIEPQTEEYSDLQNSVKENNITVSYLKSDDNLIFGNLNFEIISPSEPYNSTNENSLVMRLTYGKNTFLFTGDISKKVEEALLNSDLELKSDVLKVAHHGSMTSSSEEFLDAVNPKFSIVSAGDYDSAVPDYSTLLRLEKCSDVYITSDDGTIAVTSDGENLEITTHA